MINQWQANKWQAETTSNQWHKLSDKLPKEDTPIWVRHAPNERTGLVNFSLAHMVDRGDIGAPDYKIQSIESVEDYEGMGIEYYTDITHWAYAEPPLFKGE